MDRLCLAEEAGSREPVDRLAKDGVRRGRSEDADGHDPVVLARGEELTPVNQAVERTKAFHVGVEVDATEPVHHLVPSDIGLLRIGLRAIEERAVPKPLEILRTPDAKLPIRMPVDPGLSCS